MKGYDRTYLERVEFRVKELLNKHPLVEKLLGIGSYYRYRKVRPNDIDFVLVLNITFEKAIQDKRFKTLIETIENLKDKTRSESNNGEPTFNMFIQDNEDKILNSVDFWFILFKGETLERNLEIRKGYYYYTKNVNIDLA